MRKDNALANSNITRMLEGGDTGRRGAEHRGFLLLWFTHNQIQEVGYT